MKPVSVGDLSWAFQLQGRTQTLKTDMNQLLSELSTGQKQNLAKAVSGDFKALAGIEASLSRSQSYVAVTVEAAGLAGAMQSALEVVQDNGAQVSGPLMLAGSSGDANLARAAGRDASERLFAAVDALNSRFAQRSLFAGAETGSTALADGETIMAALETAVSALTTAQDIKAELDTWFGPGGDFETVAYQGSAMSMSPFGLGQGLTADLGFTADDERLRDTLKGFALGALLGGGVLSGAPDEEIELARFAGEALFGGESGLVAMRAEVGAVEASIDRAKIRMEAEINSLSIARADIVSADPFEAATRLEAVQTQLETVYAITVRSSQLSILDYL